MKRTMLVAVATMVMLVCAVGVIAQMKVLTFKDGRKPLVGAVKQKENVYEVTTEFAQVITVPVDQVASVTTQVNPRSEYTGKLLALKADDVNGRYDLAVWCHDNGMHKEAKQALETVLALKPDHLNAKALIEVVKQALLEEHWDESTRKSPITPLAGKVSAAELMSDEDIMRIRLAELRSWDKVGIKFRNNALKRYIEIMNTEQDRFSSSEFLHKSRVAQAIDILLDRPDDKDLHKDILIRNNPSFMSTFKSRILPILNKNCASVKCHGSGTGAGGLKLYNVTSRKDPVYYTNFYILDQKETAKGRLIDRNRPSQSLLLQYGLPDDLANPSHPPVVGKSPLFKDTNSPQYLIVDEWIRNLLNPHPAYDLKYKAPGEKPATQPAQPDAAGQPTPQPQQPNTQP
ncbi:MAG: hypothetical protein HQ546_03840 [Planctomycetes bacterium]|nr:hypothetical protein [Planctomycetota bacterium]